MENHQETRIPLTSKVRGVLVTCVSNIDFFVSWKPTDNAQMVNMS